MHQASLGFPVFVFFILALAGCGGGGSDSGESSPDSSSSIFSVSEFNPNWAHVGVFEPASTCADCHKSNGSVMQYSGEDVSPSSQWKHTVMAHSFNDPYWQAAVEDEAATFPGLAGLIEDKCTSCHAPMARTHAHHQGDDLDGDDFYRLEKALSQDHAREGVSCTLCHQINDLNINLTITDPATGAHDSRSFSGAYSISDSLQEIYGPYDSENVSPNPMFANSGGYTPMYKQLSQESEICATCHTLYTTVIDADTGQPAVPAAEFLEQAPFLEWLASDFAVAGTQCQDCHMPEPDINYETVISILPAGGNAPPVRADFMQHLFLGGNTHLLQMLAEYRSELGISDTTTEEGFEQQEEYNRSFLEEESAELAMAVNLSGTTLTADVEITNKTGHKLPSSYPSRRMWLHVTITDNNGLTVFESGRPDLHGRISTDVARLQAACMALDKPPGFDSSACYEQHRDLITDESQVAIFETVLGDTNNTITHTLLRAAGYLKDNRIPPSGFTNSKADAIEAQIKASGVSGDANFNCVGSSEGCGQDTVRYQVDVVSFTPPFDVEARLYYQSIQPAFVDGLHSSGPLVNRFKAMYQAVPPIVEELASEEIQVN
jgi:hypothetical protein